MFDANGDWLETELETAKGLNRLLCRPVKHLWLDTPEARSRHGQVRRKGGTGSGLRQNRESGPPQAVLKFLVITLLAAVSLKLILAFFVLHCIVQ